MIPVSLRNQIESSIKACIVEEGGDPEECILREARHHGLSREQAEEIADQLVDEEEDE